jgi:DNA-binding protein H-NS
MSKLAALKKQIAALEAQAERIAKEEMSSAIAKVKGIMAEFNLTIEHLTQTVASKRAAAKPKAKTGKTASAAKYADPKTGKTWTGVGRAPGWIAGAKNRDVFLVGKSPAAAPSAQAPATAKKTTAKAAKSAKAVKVAKKIAKPLAKKVVASVSSVAKPEGASIATKKKAATKKAAPKAVAAKRAAAAPVESNATPTA